MLKWHKRMYYGAATGRRHSSVPTTGEQFMSAIHTLNPERATLHGHFSRDLRPVLTIDPGDTVRFRCLDAGWGLEPYNGLIPDRREFEGRDPILDNGHALTGPGA